MRKFTVNCQFGTQSSPFTLYIGEPKLHTHPLQNQQNWLAKERGGTIPTKVMDSTAELYALSLENNVDFQELFDYAITSKENEEPGK